MIGRVFDAVKDLDTKTAASKLRVGNILTGSVRRSPQMVRINAQLVGGDDGVEHWAEAMTARPDTLRAVSAFDPKQTSYEAVWPNQKVAVTPPSISKSLPVMNAPLGPMSRAATVPTSSGVPARLATELSIILR